MLKQGLFEIKENIALTKTMYKMVLEGDASAITAPGQFAGYKEIDKYRNRDLTDCYKACKEALSGKNNIGDFLFFHADHYVDNHDEWPLFTAWHQIAGHVFFKRNW